MIVSVITVHSKEFRSFYFDGQVVVKMRVLVYLRFNPFFVTLNVHVFSTTTRTVQARLLGEKQCIDRNHGRS